LELPVGGYSDVTTHGRLEQILPSQFALDETDFLRRLAEQELLYFRREEPPRPTRQEMVVLLDQGVRTWGDVRLVLAAAVLALGKQAAARMLPFLVAATSGEGEVLDPLKVDANVLGALLEASDLTADPGLALERVLQQPARVGRDVVLLTQPRALQEDDVRAAARRVTAGTRLFALALDDAGRASLAELRHGVPVPLSQFRVNLAPPAPERVARKTELAPPGPWSGDVEPVGFPFRLGIGGPVGADLFDFDQTGEWLLTASQHGMLHAWKTDGSGHEVLPRALLEGTLLTNVQAVVGVAGGFVVGGQVKDRVVAAHYRLGRRTCTLYILGDWPAGGRWGWTYSPQHDSLVVYRGDLGWALDLASGQPYASGQEGADSRAEQAWRAWARQQVPPRKLHVLRHPTHHHYLEQPACYLNPDQGTVLLFGLKPPANADKVVGVWEVTKSAEAPPGATVEMTKDGKLILKATINGKTLSQEGTYKVEGDKIRTVQNVGGKQISETMTIKTLTDTKLVTQDENGKIDEFTGPVGLKPPWQSFTPRADGQPVLRRSVALDGAWRGTTLVLKTVALGAAGTPVLRLFRGPEGTPLGELPLSSPQLDFALSADGTRVALQVAGWQVAVRRVGEGGPGAVTRLGGFSSKLQLRLGDGWLALRTGKHHVHLLRWGDGALKVWHTRGDRQTGRSLWALAHQAGCWVMPRDEGVAGTRSGVPAGLKYDAQRFLTGAWVGELIAVSDRFGQVVLLNEELEVVCMFFVFRDRLAGWLPDGTCLGPADLTGQAESPRAAEKFGRALRQAAAVRTD
jgi:uncharacterized protein (TIGR03066 family)